MPARRSRLFRKAPAEFRIAAIDVGSNSIHMVIAQADADGGLTTLWRLKEMVGLGRISFPSRRLTYHAMDRAVETLGRFVEEAKRRQCERIVAVATSAVREAENGGDFVQRTRRELGLHVRIISARDEARLIYLGVRHEMDLKAGPQVPAMNDARNVCLTAPTSYATIRRRPTIFSTIKTRPIPPNTRC